MITEKYHGLKGNSLHCTVAVETAFDLSTVLIHVCIYRYRLTQIQPRIHNCLHQLYNCGENEIV